MAAKAHFKSEVSFVPCGSIEDVFSSVSDGVNHYGVVPVENSTEGAVNNTQDCLIDSTLTIVGEVVLPITHNFLVNQTVSEKSLSQITRIVSHKQSLAQCRSWLQTHFPEVEIVEVSSNAQAAKLASENSTTAAIAGDLAADIYNLKVIHRAIQDKSNNSTRFLVVSCASEVTTATGADKTSVLIYTDNKPGALFRILAPFENLEVSLSKIETRPSKIEAWEYVFFIDFDGHALDPTIIELFARLESCTAEIKVLGSYPKFERSA